MNLKAATSIRYIYNISYISLFVSELSTNSMKALQTEIYKYCGGTMF